VRLPLRSCSRARPCPASAVTVTFAVIVVQSHGSDAFDAAPRNAGCDAAARLRRLLGFLPFRLFTSSLGASLGEPPLILPAAVTPSHRFVPVVKHEQHEPRIVRVPSQSLSAGAHPLLFFLVFFPSCFLPSGAAACLVAAATARGAMHRCCPCFLFVLCTFPVCVRLSTSPLDGRPRPCNA
jgi:hypothetical protein